MARTGSAGIRYPAGSARWDALCAGLAGALCAAALVGWALAVQPVPPAWWLLATAAAGLTLWTVWGLRRPPYGEIAWQPADEGDGPGGGWRWFSAARPRGVPVSGVRVALDLGGRVLLQARTPDGLTLWLWCLEAAAGDDPADWLALRRALSAHADGAGRSGIFDRPEPTP